MDKINFENLPSTNTPVNATNLNQMQTNIENAIENSVTYTLSATKGWKRIAMLYDTAFTNLTITNNPSYGTVLNLTASVLRGYQPIIIRNVYRMSNDRLFTKARIVHKFNEQRAYLELYQNLEQAKPLYIKASNNSKGLTFMEAETEGSVPDGYEVYEISLYANDAYKTVESVEIDLSTGSGYANFPEGFNKDNCIIIGHRDVNIYNVVFGNIQDVYVYISGDANRVQASSSSGNFSGNNAKTYVFLLKTN